MVEVVEARIVAFQVANASHVGSSTRRPWTWRDGKRSNDKLIVQVADQDAWRGIGMHQLAAVKVRIAKPPTLQSSRHSANRALLLLAPPS